MTGVSDWSTIKLVLLLYMYILLYRADDGGAAQRKGPYLSVQQDESRHRRGLPRPGALALAVRPGRPDNGQGAGRGPGRV